MRTISIMQPHATLLLLGLKRYETRSWKAWPALIGARVGIHAGKSTEDMDELGEYLYDLHRGGPVIPELDKYRTALLEGGIKHLGQLPLGCVLGSAVLKADHPTEALAEPGPFGDFRPGRRAWEMSERLALPVPIPWRGMQGFFEVPDQVFAVASGPNVGTAAAEPAAVLV